jgi:hypothetical protein
MYGLQLWSSAQHHCYNTLGYAQSAFAARFPRWQICIFQHAFQDGQLCLPSAHRSLIALKASEF